jgi:hypothetical protein
MLVRRYPQLAAIAAAFTVMIAACGGGDGVQIIALTATPTPTPGAASGGGATTTPEATPPPSEPVPLPDRPENPFAGSRVVAAYLAGGLAEFDGCVQELREGWNMPPTRGERCVFADFDADGEEEFAYLITVDGAPPPADIWLFDDRTAGFNFLTSIRTLANEVLFSLELLPAADLSGDGAPEVIAVFERCDGDLCRTDFVVASVEGGLLRDLVPANASVESVTSIEISDANGDGVDDIVVVGGAVAVAGAGPPRSSETVLGWNGRDLDATTTPGPPEFLSHLVFDADLAFVSGDFTRARQLYLQAASDRLLRDWKAENGQAGGRAELAPYSLFRAGLAAQRSGDQAGFLAQLTDAATRHASTLHGAAAGAYLAVINAGGAPGAACAAAEGVLLPVADLFALIWDYGFANPEHTITGICR